MPTPEDLWAEAAHKAELAHRWAKRAMICAIIGALLSVFSLGVRIYAIAHPTHHSDAGCPAEASEK
jgi:hypothetical protein